MPLADHVTLPSLGRRMSLCLLPARWDQRLAASGNAQHVSVTA